MSEQLDPVFHERLTKMVAFLAKLEPRNFCMLHVAQSVLVDDRAKEASLPRGTTARLQRGIGKPKEFCGAAACIWGWMPAVFPEQFEFNTLSDSFGGVIWKESPAYGGFARGGAKWFGISLAFFYPSSYPTPGHHGDPKEARRHRREVVTALRAVLAGRLSPSSSHTDIDKYVTTTLAAKDAAGSKEDS